MRFLQVGDTMIMACWIALLLLIAGASPVVAQESDEPVHGGILRVAASDGVSSTDPAVHISELEVFLGFMIFDNLTETNEGIFGSPLKPELAVAWEMTDDGLTHTFFLRKGVLFHHGREFVAEDVKYTMERLQDPDLKARIGQSLATVESIDIIDDYTIRFTLSEPDVTLPFTLSTSGFQIVPHDLTNEELATAPSGTGPFKFVENLPNERLTLERNADYWDGNRPYLDGVDLLTIPEPFAQSEALQNDIVDVVLTMGADEALFLKSDPNVQILESRQGFYPVFVMDVTQPPFDDIRVRQAFKHAINRVDIHRNILRDRGTVLNDHPIAPDTLFFANVPPLAYDPEQAMDLLTEAGYPDGLEVTLSIADVFPGIINTAVIMQNMVKEANLTINLEVVPANDYWAEHYMQTPFFVSFWGTNGEPNRILSQVYSLKGGFNESRWSDPEVDALIAEARGLVDTEDRLALYTEIQQRISHDGAVIMPYLAPILMATRTDVKGIVSQIPLHLQYVWLEPAD